MSADANAIETAGNAQPAPKHRIATASGIAAACVGVSVLLGWMFDMEILKRIGPGMVAMNPMTAIGFLLLGGVLVELGRSGKLSGLASLAAGIVCLIGCLKLLHILGGIDLGVDRFVFMHKLTGANGLNINPMAPLTAFNFLFSGLSAFLLSSGHRHLRLWGQAGAALVALLSAVAAVGYAYGVLGLYRVGSFFPMALHTAVTFLITSTGLLWLYPGDGAIAVITSPHMGGKTARFLLPAIVGIPLVLGLLWIDAVQSGMFNPVSGMAIFVIADICVLGAIVAAVVLRLDRASIALAQHTSALEEATRLADGANRAKSNFLANMSHEIRTPMNGVLGMLEILDHTKLDANQGRIVGTIRSSARSLLDIINDILDFSKIEAGHLSVESAPCDVADILEGTVRLFVGAAVAKGVTLRCFAGSELRGRFLLDAVRLRQILSNLVSNAIKFTREGGITIVADVDDGTGIGISPSAQIALFKPFVQADDFDGAQIRRDRPRPFHHVCGSRN